MSSDIARVLIADDDNDDQLLMRQAISEIDRTCQVTSVFNGMELLKYLSINHPELLLTATFPDVILLDINMPLLNGFGALAEIKKTDMLRNIPVYIMSTSHSRTDILLARDLGAAGFYTKPVEFEELKRILREIFSSTAAVS